jgi:lactate permease
MVAYSSKELLRAWTPWVILTVFVFVWGLPPVKDYLNTCSWPSSRWPA